MPKNDIAYYATYCKLDDTSGDSGIIVDGNMMSVGTELELTPQLHVTERGKEIPRVVLGKGKRAAGFIPDNVFKAHVKDALDNGWTVRAVVAAVAYNRLEDKYWGEVAIFCYDDSHKDAFDAFVRSISKRIAQGEHPAVALSAKELERVVESGGKWCGTQKVQLEVLPKGSVWYKTKQTMTEKAAFSAASGNKGCYLGFIAVVVVALLLVYFLFIR